MTRLIYYLCEIVSTIIKVWVSFELVDAVSKPRWSKMAGDVVKILTAVILAGMNSYNNILAEGTTAHLFSNGLLLVMIVVILFVSKMVYKQRWWYLINLTFIFWISITLLDFFVLALLYIVLSLVKQNLYTFISITFARAVYLLMYSAACVWCGKKIREYLRKRSIKKYQGWISLAILPLSVFLMNAQRIYTIEYYDHSGNPTSIEDIIGIWSVFGLFLFVVSLLFVYYRIHQKDAEERRLQQLKLQMLESNYQSLMQVYEEKAILLHDIKNHIQMIREMVEHDEKGEVLTYLDTMSRKLLQNKHRDMTNHKLLNLILNMKFHEAEVAGISVKYEFDDMSELQLKPMEICALFTNLLDNAIEANEKLAAGLPRYLHMSCIRKNNMLLLNLSNPVGEDVKVVDGELPFTTKEDKQSHGFGMRSVRQILENYEGHMRIDVEEQVFLVTVYLRAF